MIKIIIFLFLFGINTTSFAQTPVNDEPCTALDLSISANCSLPYSTSTVGATNSLVTGLVALNCGGATAPKDVWFRVKTTQTGSASDTRLAIETLGAAAGQIRIFSSPGCFGPFSELACSANPSESAPVLYVNNLTPSTYYYVEVAGYWDNSVGGAFSICVTPGPVLGCTNPNAANYNINAVIDDGSCLFTANPISKCDATLYNNNNLLINDNQTIIDSINIAYGPNKVITDMDLVLKINHSFLSDLNISLISPSGTSVNLFNNQCGGSDNLEVYFDDSAYNLTCNSPTKGFYKPTNGSLSSFNNQLTDGNWKLKITDNSLGNTGNLISWCLKPKFQSVVCNAPAQLSVDSIASNSAKLFWTINGNTSLGFDVALMLENVVFNNLPTNTNVSNQFKVNNLLAATTYKYYVRSRCAANILSSWSGPYSFKTALPNPSCNLALTIPENTSCLPANNFYIDVKNVNGSQLGVNTILDEVRLVIFHDWTSDLQVSLTSPSGKNAILAYQNGGSGDHYGDPSVLDCSKYASYSAKACQNLPEKAPFIGKFLPVGDMNVFNDGSNPNGIWTLTICDVKAANIGQLRGVNLVFSNNLCAAPSNLAVSNVQSTFVSVNFQNSACDSVILTYGNKGFNPLTSGTKTKIVCPANPPFTIAGLQNLTNYDLYVQKKCTNGNFSNPSCPVEFFTPCNNATPSLIENFNTQTTCNAYCGDTCSINGTWYNARNDDFDWIIKNGATLTPESGPISDVETTGNYAYTETGGYGCQYGKKGILYSKCLNINTIADTCSLSFYYNMYGVNMGKLSVECSQDGGATWILLWSLSGNQGEGWRRQYLDLTPYNNKTVQLRFVGISGDGPRSEIAIDNISFFGVSVSNAPLKTYFADLDGDGFGVPQTYIKSCSNTPPVGYSNFSTDCNDTNATIFPGAQEVYCNQIDENCNGNADDTILPIPTISNDSVCIGSNKTLTVSSNAIGKYYWTNSLLSTTYYNTGQSLALNNLQKDTTFYIKDSVTIYPELRITEVRLNGLRGVEVQNIGPAKDFTGWYLAFSNSISINFINTPYSQYWDLGNFGANQIQTKQNVSGVFNLTWTQGGRGWVLLIDNNGKVADCVFWNYSEPEINNFNVNLKNNKKFKTVDLPWSGSGVIIPSGCGSPTFTNTIQLFTNKEKNNALDYNPCYPNTFGANNNTFNILGGCVSPTKQVKLFVKKYPTLTLSNTYNICEGQNFDLQNVIVNDATNQSGVYTYHTGTPTTTINQLLNTNVKPAATTNFYIKKTINPGCDAVVSLQLNVKSKPIANISVIDTSSNCSGQTKILTVNSTGGAPPYFHLWNTGQIATQINVGSAFPQPTDIYKVVVQDLNGCKDTSSVDVSGGTGITKAKLLNIKAVTSCNGTDGGFTILPINGVAPYQYAWTGGQSGLIGNQPNGNFTVNNFKKGTYSVTITDSSPLQCQLVIPFIVVESPEVQAKLDTVINISCKGKIDGQIKLSVSSALPLQYKWSNNQTTKNIANLPKGLYSCTITNSTCAQVINNIEVKEPDSLKIANADIANVSCTLNGKIDLSTSGGSQPIKFLWNNGATSEDLTNIAIGFYKVTVTDNRNCSIVSPNYLLASAPVLSIASYPTPSKCNGESSGAIKIIVNGGGRPYKYLWSNGRTKDTINQVKAGIYYVTVTDANGCSMVSLPISITQPLSLNTNVVVKNITCQGKKDGEITLNTIGGTAPYIYNWQHTLSDSSMLKSLLSATYKVTIIDKNGCFQKIDTIKIKTPSVVKLTLDNVFTPSCIGRADGKIFITTSGGTQPYTFTWSNTKTTEDLFAVKNGFYSVSVSDNFGCKNNIDSIKVNATQTLSIDSVQVTNPKCFAANNGKIYLRIKGGAPQYIYAWSNGAFSSDIFNLNGGLKTVTVTDAFGCSFEKTFNLVEPQKLTININAIDSITCNGLKNGAIDIGINGGALPLTYIWNTGSKAEDLVNIGTGTYKVAVFDAKGCTANSQEITLPQPDRLSISLNPNGTQNNCNSMANGYIDINTIGGSRPYTYYWNTNEISEDITVSQAGNYSVTVTDKNGCDNALNGIAMQTPVNPMKLDTVTLKKITCHNDANGAIFISCKGGKSPYNFNWSTGDLHIKNISSDTLANVYGGSFNVTVTDAYGCVIKRDSFSFQNPNELIINLLDLKNVNCKGDKTGEIDLNVTGGVLPYNVVWSNDSIGQNLKKLKAGTYKAKITDANLCIRSSNNFTISEPAKLLTIKLDSIRNGNCNANQDGAIFISATGGETPYDYVWNNNINTNSNIIQNLVTGNYVCKITDALKCTQFSDTFKLSKPNANISIIITEVKNNKCFNGFEGAIKINTLGGTMPYTYLWSNAAVTKDLIDIQSGNYTLTITDKNNCKQTSSTINVSAPDSIKMTILFRKAATAPNVSNGYLVYKLSGGTPPYQLTSSTGVMKTNPQDTIKNLQNGILYEFALRDANNCIVFVNNISILSNILDLELVEKVTIFPNPVSDILEIKADFKKYLNTKLRLINQVGQIVTETNLSSQNIDYLLDVSNQNSGLYYLQMIDLENQHLLFNEKVSIIK